MIYLKMEKKCKRKQRDSLLFNFNCVPFQIRWSQLCVQKKKKKKKGTS